MRIRPFDLINGFVSSKSPITLIFTPVYTPSIFKKLALPFLVDSGRFVRAFGDIATPRETAIKDTLAWYRDYAV